MVSGGNSLMVRSALAGDLRENVMVVQQRDHDQLAEQPAARGLEEIP
jgi:hypothetical protein